jgi:putative transposase
MLSKKIALMKLPEEVKPQSGKCQPAGRQGYGAFSVNPAEADTVIRYIANQKVHHGKVTFRDEYRAFLKEYEWSMMRDTYGISYRA